MIQELLPATTAEISQIPAINGDDLRLTDPIRVFEIRFLF